MYNYYFIYFMREYGKENFINLTNKILNNTKFEGKIQKFSVSDDWLFLYFCSVFYVIALKYFGLDEKQIDFCLDMIIAPGYNNLFDSKELLKKHSDVIPEIEMFIKKELEKYHS